MARDQRLLPWRQLVVGIDEQCLGLLLKLSDLVGDLRTFAVLVERLELDNLVFEFENRFLKIEIGAKGGGSAHVEKPFEMFKIRVP